LFYFINSIAIVNIWSHLVGAAYYIVSFATFLTTEIATDAPARDFYSSHLAAVSVYYLGTIVSFTLSTTFHIFSDHSYPLCRFSNNLDHVGIVFGIWGAGIAFTHFSLYCAPLNVRLTYFCAQTAASGFAVVLTLRSYFHQSGVHAWRSIIYFLLGASLFIPFLQALNSVGSVEELNKAAGLGSFLWLAIIHSIGGILYVVRVPERWFPGKFDICGQSHNWMHFLVVLGAYVGLRGLLEAYQYWRVAEGLITTCQSTM
jgi:adiponectin receptor